MRLYPHIDKEHIISSLKESSIKLTSYTEDSIEILGSIDVTIHFGESGKNDKIPVQNTAEIQLISSSSDVRFNPDYKQCNYNYSHTINISEFQTTEILEELPTHVYNISVTSNPERIKKEKSYAINNAIIDIINNGVKDLIISKTEARYNIKQDTATPEELSKFFDPQKQ